MGKKQGKKNNDKKNHITANVSYKGGKWANEIKYTRDFNGGNVSAGAKKEGGNPWAQEYRLTKYFNGGKFSASAIKERREPWKQQIRFSKDFSEKTSGYFGISRTSGQPKSTTFEFGFNTSF